MPLVHAQGYIYGKITDSVNHPIASANVAILNNGFIVAYVKSEENGRYKFTQQTKGTPYQQLQFTSVGYQKKVIAVTASQKEYNVVLKASNDVLKEILVRGKPAPIQKRGDTTNFDLSFYKAPQDRVIEDVLKKIPGIEITDAGKISYNGRSITSFFIDGDNLLDDKYALGTKTIPSGMVDTLQVFENHQPIKALSKISPSYNVSLNIILNPEAKIKITGLVNLGLGTSRHFKEEANLMSLKKDFKTLNIIKYNSDGYDLSKEITAQNFMERNNNLNRNIYDPLIDLNTIAAPNLNQNKYLFNRALLTTSNQLFKLRNDVQLKLSAHYFGDAQQSSFSRLTEKIILIDTIRFFEEQNQNYKPQNLALSADVSINKKKYYFNNILAFKKESADNIAQLLINANPLGQELGSKPYEFYNEAKYIRSIRHNKAIEVSSFISKSGNRQNLNINPPVFNGYGSQYINMPQLFVNNSLAIKISTGKIFQDYKISHTYDATDINSSINGIYSNDLGNSLQWRYNRLQFGPSVNYVNEKVKLSVVLPINYNLFRYHDRLYGSNQTTGKLAFEPKISIKINQGKENRLTAQYQYKNNFGDAATQYQGYILLNYRALNAYDTDFLLQSNTHNFSAGYNFSKSLSLFAFNVLGLYSVKENNSISQLSLNGFNQTTLQLPMVNYNRNLRLMAGINKYIFALKTTAKANFGVQQHDNNQFINARLLSYKTIVYTLGLGTDTKLSSKTYLKYNALYVPVKSKTSGFSSAAQKNSYFNQKTELVLLPVKPMIFKINAEHQFYKSTSSDASDYLFLDLNVNWKFQKSQQEVTFSVINLSNIKSYRTNYLSAYTNARSEYQLLGRFFQVNYVFNF